MTEGQRRLLAIGGVAALVWYLSRSPSAQADLSALYRSLTQGLGGAAAPPQDGGIGVGGGPATNLFRVIQNFFNPSQPGTAPTGGSYRVGSAPIVTPGTTPSQIVGYISQVVQNGYKLVQQVTDQGSLLNKGVDYVKSLFDTGASATLNVTGGTVGNGADVLGTGATTVTAPDTLLPVGQGGIIAPTADASTSAALPGGADIPFFDPATVGGPAPGGAAELPVAADGIGAGGVDAATAAETGGAVVTEATTVSDAAIFAAEGAAVPVSAVAGGILFGVSVAVGAGLAAWQESEIEATWPMFGGKLRDTISKIRFAVAGGGGDPLSARLSRVRTKQELADEVGGFKSAIEAAGVGGYASQGGVFTLAPIPGAGGSAHEQGITADFSSAQAGLQQYIDKLAVTLPGPVPTAPDQTSTKYAAARATYTDTGLTTYSPDPLSTIRGIELASMGGGVVPIGTVSGTDTLRTVTIPDTRPAPPDPNDVTAQYASAGVMAGNAPQGGGF